MATMYPNDTPPTLDLGNSLFLTFYSIATLRVQPDLRTSMLKVIKGDLVYSSKIHIYVRPPAPNHPIFKRSFSWNP